MNIAVKLIVLAAMVGLFQVGLGLLLGAIIARGHRRPSTRHGFHTQTDTLRSAIHTQRYADFLRRIERAPAMGLGDDTPGT